MLVSKNAMLSENALALEASGYAFFESLFRQAPPGATLLVLETTHRAFPGIVAAAQRGVAAAGSDDGGGSFSVQVDCPWVTSNTGYSLLLRKRDDVCEPHAGDEGDGVAALLERFERDRELHTPRVVRSVRRWREPVRPAAAHRNAPVAMLDPTNDGTDTQRYHVYLENDNVNMREYVARTLMMVCELSEDEATSVMAEASSSWMARCGTWEKAVAQHVYDGLRQAGLSVVMTPAVEDADGGPSDATLAALDGLDHWVRALSARG